MQTNHSKYATTNIDTPPTNHIHTKSPNPRETESKLSTPRIRHADWKARQKKLNPTTNTSRTDATHREQRTERRREAKKTAHTAHKHRFFFRFPVLWVVCAHEESGLAAPLVSAMRTSAYDVFMNGKLSCVCVFFSIVGRAILSSSRCVFILLAEFGSLELNSFDLVLSTNACRLMRSGWNSHRMNDFFWLTGRRWSGSGNLFPHQFGAVRNKQFGVRTLYRGGRVCVCVSMLHTRFGPLSAHGARRESQITGQWGHFVVVIRWSMAPTSQPTFRNYVECTISSDVLASGPLFLRFRLCFSNSAIFVDTWPSLQSCMQSMERLFLC